jgi:hypothetical protein
MSTGRVVAIALFLLTLLALAEMLADSRVRALDAPHASSWRAVLRIGDDARARGDIPAARRAYLTALFRARGERSLAGVLSATQGFEALGDREVLEHAFRIAASLKGEATGADSPRRRQVSRDALDASGAPPVALDASR